MPIAIAVPTDRALTYEQRDAVLRVSGVDGGPLELRVDDGLVFARYLAREPRTWCDVTLASLLPLYAANSPVASFLRAQGVIPLRHLVLEARSAAPLDGA